MTTRIKSLSPVDGGIVWEGDATPESDVALALQRAHLAALRWRRSDVKERIEVVRQFGRLLDRGRAEITDLITREVGKPGWDASAEVNAAVAKIELSIQALEGRRSTRLLDEAGTESEIQRRIRYHPLGVAVVLGPFNFPLHLPGGQIIPALLAGNAVVFKPSEQATAVGLWMSERWREAGLPSNLLETIVGGADVAAAAIDSPHVGGVFLTGSRAAGRAIHQQLAGRPGVLLALELGGNNPMVVTDSVSPGTVASLVSFSAFVSAGQRCTCARRAIFVTGDSTEQQIDALVRATQQLRVGLPGDDPAPQVGPLISPQAAQSLFSTYQQLLQLGCQPLVPYRSDPALPSLVHPAVVDATTLDQDGLRQLGEMEWFGPLLVLQRVATLDTALESAAMTPYGLAASLLGGTESMFERFVSHVGAGVVNWNGPTTGAAGALPFGGLGDSGNHRPAGSFAIDFCSDPVASLERSQPPQSDPWSVAK